ncbi:hypothetical protein V6N13_100239 [Hibiscus sabdariffa]|uniref:Uncharacterized protein n=2 Tax=Hibiscus sabdariffa TaxID=183260 RepID=A0ABR2NUM8_9ROSI
MLVQKINPDSDRISIPPPTIRVRVKYDFVYHEIHINSQATFGVLKKMLTGPNSRAAAIDAFGFRRGHGYYKIGDD